MVTLVRVYLALVVVVMMTFEPVMTAKRVGAKFKYIPACYKDSATLTNTIPSRCNNPLYKTCRRSNTDHICCGPDHYCCNFGNACCRDITWSRYEVVAVVCGSIAWLCIFIVLGICLGPTLWKRIRRSFKTAKVHP